MQPTLCFKIQPCSLGYVLIAYTSSGILAILPGDSPETVMQEFKFAFPDAALRSPGAADLDTIQQVVNIVEGKATSHDLLLDLGGTPFARKVWTALRAIPVGETRSYADIAAAIAQPKAVRAVARACTANVLAVAILCHRVVRSDGALSGYRWGIARKEQLLKREQQQTSHLS